MLTQLLLVVFMLISTGYGFDACPHQLPDSTVLADSFGKIYSTEGSIVGVTFHTSDKTLQQIYDHGVECENANGAEFLPGLHVVVEGSHYTNVWLETQPMAGAMWAVRNMTEGLANQLVFMRTIREDGRLPGMVTTNGSALNAEYCFGSNNDMSLLQGDYFSLPSVDIAFLMNESIPGGNPEVQDYVRELHTVLERFENWMWHARHGNGSLADTLWTPSATDWGGDGFDGYQGYQPPFVSMDMMAYAYSNAVALNRTSTILENSTGVAHWTKKAEAAAAALKRVLWSSSRSACYDQDANGSRVDVLMHNNLRCMWHGVFDQEMADAFVAKHLRNPSEFWTPFPLPSIAANDPKYHPGLPRNDWSGPAEGLTYQRAIRALTNYGYHSEVTMLGTMLHSAIAVNMTFPQQWNPKQYESIPAGAAGPGDCYGPALLSALEYTTYMFGIKINPANGMLLWSASLPLTSSAKAVSTFTQQFGSNTWVNEITESQFSGRQGKTLFFNATIGIRVVTNLDGDVAGVVGISTKTVRATLWLPRNEKPIIGTVEPNSEYIIVSGHLVLQRQVPFIPPTGNID